MFNLPLDHIGLHCSDVEENAKWYQEKLGFKVVGKFPGKVDIIFISLRILQTDRCMRYLKEINSRVVQQREWII